MPSNRFAGLRRTLLASFSSILSIFLLFFIPSALGGLLSMSIYPVLHGVGLGFFAAIYSAFIIFLWGIPIHLILKYFGINSVVFYMISGFVGGPLFLVLIRPFGVDPIDALTMQIAITGALGVLASIVFWCVAVKGSGS